MKILFISPGDQPDYLSDCLYHGLKTTMGTDVESATDIWYMYDTLTDNERRFLYGRGFTLYGLLSTSLKNVPHYTETESRIKAHYYDYVIYGSVIKSKALLTLVEQHYSPAEIIFIDGEDIHYYEKALLNKGIYFKRELKSAIAGIHPISFAIPEEKIVQNIPQKTRDWAINYPGRLNTYIHHTEQSYYNDYQTSRFAVTFKKEGWDCLRHYEILANGGLPYFTDVLDCPPETMVNFPKQTVTEIFQILKTGRTISVDEYNNYATALLDYTRKHLTTTILAQQVLTIAEERKNNQQQSQVKNGEAVFSWGDIADKYISFQPATAQGKLLYASVANTQYARFLAGKFTNTTVCDDFISAATSFIESLADKNSISRPDNIYDIEATAATIVLDQTLTYREDVTDYLIKVRSLMNDSSTLMVIVPNFRNFSSVIGFIKHNLKFGKLKLAKRSPANFYSEASVTRLLKSFGFNVKAISYYGFNNTHFVKRFFNRFSSLKAFNCETLFIEANLKNE